MVFFHSCLQHFYFSANHIKALVCKSISSYEKDTKEDIVIVRHHMMRQLGRGDLCMMISTACICVRLKLNCLFLNLENTTFSNPSAIFLFI